MKYFKLFFIIAITFGCINNKSDAVELTHECVHGMPGNMENYAYVTATMQCPPPPMHNHRPWLIPSISLVSNKTKKGNGNSIKQAPTEPECIYFKRPI